MGNKPVYCMHCARWYAPTKADQCDLPPVASETTTNAIGYKAPTEECFGHPSKLNQNNDCQYYEGIGFLHKLLRRIIFGIPMRPELLETQINKQNKDKGSIEDTLTD